MSELFSTPDLCDEHPEVQVIRPGFKCYGGKELFHGQIVTVKCFEDNSLVKSQVQESGAGKVLVVDGGQSMRCAMLGDQLAAKAFDNGWSGIVISGCIRDVEIIAKINIAVRALGTHPKKSLKKGVGELNIEIDICGTLIKPDQYIYGDLNGMVISDVPLLEL